MNPFENFTTEEKVTLKNALVSESNNLSNDMRYLRYLTNRGDIGKTSLQEVEKLIEITRLLQIKLSETIEETNDKM